MVSTIRNLSAPSLGAPGRQPLAPKTSSRMRTRVDQEAEIQKTFAFGRCSRQAANDLALSCYQPFGRNGQRFLSSAKDDEASVRR